MPKDIRCLPRHILIIQQAQRTRSSESIQLKQYPQGLGRYILRTTEGDITDDLQGSWEIDHRLCRTCLEYKHTRLKLQKHPIYTERGSGIATGCHKMSSVDHLHAETKMLKVMEHSELLSAQYLARCLEPGTVCHSITTREPPKKRKKETLFTRHRNTVEPMMLWNTRKATL